MRKLLTIVVADDHAIVREGLKLLLSTMDHVSVVAEAADGETLTTIVRASSPDLVILDLGMPGVAGVQFINELRAVAPRMKILALTANIEPRTVRAVIAAGASGYLTKTGDPAELNAALDAMLRNEIYLSQSVRFAIDDPRSHQPPPTTDTALSPIPSPAAKCRSSLSPPRGSPRARPPIASVSARSRPASIART